jgi:anaphase-promoting complex subunit 3
MAVAMTTLTLRSLVAYALDHDMLDTAEFTAERLLAQSQAQSPPSQANTNTNTNTNTNMNTAANATTSTAAMGFKNTARNHASSVETPTPHNTRKGLLFNAESTQDPIGVTTSTTGAAAAASMGSLKSMLADNTHLYAHVLLERDRSKAAYNAAAEYAVLHVGCSYVFGRACLKLGRESEGIRALLRTMSQWETFKPDAVDNVSIAPDAVACYMLLGKLYAAAGDVPRASMHCSNVLKLNPYIFEAFELLCKMGVKVKVDSIYKMGVVASDDATACAGVGTGVDDDEMEYELDNLTGLSKDFDKNSGRNSTSGNAIFKTPITKIKQPGVSTGARSPESSFLTPINKSSFSKRVFSKRGNQPNSRATGPGLGLGSGLGSGSGSANSRPSNIPTTVSGISASSSNARRAASITSRLLHNSSGITLNSLNEEKDTAGINSRTLSDPFTNNNIVGAGVGNDSNVEDVFSSSRKNLMTRHSSRENGTGTNLFDLKEQTMNMINTTQSSGGVDAYTISVYSKLAKGFAAFTAYDCFKAIRIFDSLPEHERNTPWVLSKQGRLHFEIVNYSEAENYFKRLRSLDRTRMEDMDYYSTLLWHLHKEVDLSFLSHELYEIDPQCAETWISVGNLFSFRKEPEDAIKCFNKAIEFDSECAYAFTLQGHEYLATDAFENALSSFRHAIILDKRHYNAFYGIGMVYLKLGDFRKAEFHFRKALEINPVNVILICCVGVVLEKLGRREDSLKQYEFACKLQPLSMLALFKKAQVLFTLQRYDEALRDFEKLENLAPDEASVHFLLGKLYKHFEMKHDAIKQFTIALNLDPKGSHLIKEAMENLNDGVMS